MQITRPDALPVRLHALATQHRQPFEPYVDDHLRLTLDYAPNIFPKLNSRWGEPSCATKMMEKYPFPKFVLSATDADRR